MEDLKLTELTEKDIPLISRLAEITWNQHYPSIIGQQQVDYMLNLMYSTQSLLEQMKQKGHLFYSIDLGNESIGFISVHKLNNDDWFLNKYYINQQKAARGIGSRSFKLLLEKINPRTITLTVNRKNHKSVNFYFKNGFTIEEVKDFDIGNGFVMEDFVMKWEKK
jgi:RimJ/RimL family protein N-acetyltransferase